MISILKDISEYCLFFCLLCVLDLIVDFSKENLAQAFMNCTLVFNLLPNPDIKVIEQDGS